MKLILYSLILTLSIILVGCEKKELVDQDDLVERNGLYYEKFSEEPYTGEMVDWSEDGSLIKSKGSYKKGLKKGLWEILKDDSSIEKGYYKKGLKIGLWEVFTKNGDLIFKGSYENNLKKGVWEGYRSDNGRQTSKTNFKNGKKHGPYEGYSKWGQVYVRGHYIEGKQTGIWEWYDNGQIENKGYFKDDSGFILMEYLNGTGQLTTTKCNKGSDPWLFFYTEVDMSFCEGHMKNE